MRHEQCSSATPPQQREPLPAPIPSEDGGSGAVAFLSMFAAASFVCGFTLCSAAAIFTLSLAAVGWSAGLFVDIATDATLVRCHALPASRRTSMSPLAGGFGICVLAPSVLILYVYEPQQEIG